MSLAKVGGPERTRTSTPKHYHLKVACTANFTTGPLIDKLFKMVGDEGVEPSPSAPKAGVLPLYQSPWSWLRDSNPRSPSYKEGAEPLCQASIKKQEHPYLQYHELCTPSCDGCRSSTFATPGDSSRRHSKLARASGLEPPNLAAGD